MIIEINAFDTLFFRDGRPFVMGEDHWTNSIFPPNMSTIYGALRTAYFIENMKVFEKLRVNNELNTEKDPTKNLRIKKMFYRIKNDDNANFYYNMPLDLIALKEESNIERYKSEESKKYKVHLLKIKQNKYISSNPLTYLLYYDQPVKSITDGIINKYMIEDYIKGETDKIEACMISDYLLDEAKIGIGIDKNLGISKESRLYRIDFKRPKDLSLIVEFDGLEIKEESVIRIGGEGKYVSYRECKEYMLISDSFNVIKDVNINNRFKISLLTPAIFKNGWIPMWINEEDFIFESGKFKIKLVAAAIGKYILIGGYDIANNKPKLMLKAVPAGSTYYFEIVEGNSKDIIEYFHMKSISDIMQNEGYGISFVSKWGE